MQVLKAKTQSILEEELNLGNGGKGDIKTVYQFLEQQEHQDKPTGEHNTEQFGRILVSQQPALQPLAKNSKKKILEHVHQDTYNRFKTVLSKTAKTAHLSINHGLDKSIVDC